MKNASHTPMSMITAKMLLRSNEKTHDQPMIPLHLSVKLLPFLRRRELVLRVVQSDDLEPSHDSKQSQSVISTRSAVSRYTLKVCLSDVCICLNTAPTHDTSRFFIRSAKTTTHAAFVMAEGNLHIHYMELVRRVAAAC